MTQTCLKTSKPLSPPPSPPLVYHPPAHPISPKVDFVNTGSISIKFGMDVRDGEKIFKSELEGHLFSLSIRRSVGPMIGLLVGLTLVFFFLRQKTQKQ